MYFKFKRPLNLKGLVVGAITFTNEIDNKVTKKKKVASESDDEDTVALLFKASPSINRFDASRQV